MTVSKISKGLLLGLALLLATSVFAANKGSLQVSDPVTVNGKQIPAGRGRTSKSIFCAAGTLSPPCLPG